MSIGDGRHVKCRGCPKILDKGHVNKYGLCSKCYRKYNAEFNTYRKVKKSIGD